jgi:hypothetical protein
MGQTIVAPARSKQCSITIFILPKEFSLVFHLFILKKKRCSKFKKRKNRKYFREIFHLQKKNNDVMFVGLLSIRGCACSQFFFYRFTLTSQ